MILSRSRTILGVTALISLIVSCLVLSVLPFGTDLALNINIAAAIIFGLNIAIVFSWLVVGSLGILMSLISAIAVVWVNLKTGFYGPYVPAFLLQFALSTIIGYRCRKHVAQSYGHYNLKLEKLSEEENVLANQVKTKMIDIGALDDRLKRYSALKEVAESLSTVLSLDEICQIIMEKTLFALEKPGRVLLFLVDPAKQELMLTASRDAAGVKTKKGDVFDKWTLHHRRSLIIEDISKDFRFPAEDIDESKNIFKSLIETPLVTENKIIGALRMDSAQELLYTQDDLRLLDIVANLGAVAIQNAMLYARTQELATKDGLTGLAVRRHFMERFKEEMKRAKLSGTALSFILLDIDRFKNYNDSYGHAAGDIVLRHMARVIETAIEGSGIAVRYGGEEMAALLCGKNKKEAFNIAEGIRKAVKDNPLTLRRYDTKITVSIGLSGYPEDASSEEDLIRIADERLYKAKTEGRDRVET